MSSGSSRVPDVGPVARERLAAMGEAGAEWLAGLPDLVRHLERRWSITVGEPFDEGTTSYVARVRTAAGCDAVLKLSVPDLEFARQVRTIERAAGRGYAGLIAQDVGNHAVLLESLGPSMARLGLTPERSIDALCETLRQAWSLPRPEGMTVPPEKEKAAGLAELVGTLWEDLGRPCSERVVARALEYAGRRAAAFDLDRCVVVHGDPHPGNALRVSTPRPGAESGFVLVDPDGFLADPTYDLGVVLRDWCAQLLAGDAVALARGYCARLAQRSGLQESAIWEWGFLERVSTGLYALRYGAEGLGRPFLESAERLMVD